MALVDSPAVELARLIEALAPADVINGAMADVRELEYDSRTVRPGALFFCVRGERADGHDFAEKAVERGAVALVVEEPVPLRVPQLVVPDVRRAMSGIAGFFYGQPSHELLVGGVTGTNGKTTTSFLLFAVLAAAGLRPGLLGTIESRVGGERRPAQRTTPEAIDLQRTLREMVDVGDRSCALEATSHGAELGRLAGLRFAVLVFTNLSRDHLDFHGTLEKYFAAKRGLFVCDDPPPAAVNVSDAFGRRLAEELTGAAQAPVMTFGLTSDADVYPKELEIGRRGSTFHVGGIDVKTPLLGGFNVLNVLGVVAASRLLGLPDTAIVDGITSVRGVPGRFEAVDEGQPFSVVVDYAHTPDSLGNVLRTARDLGAGRLICVFGCGGERDVGKRPLMGEIASREADITIVTSDNPRGEDPGAIVEAILHGADGGVEVDLDRRRAIEHALELASDGDVVVIAGKGHEQGQEIAGKVLPFDDREVVREALWQLGARR
jgi:UDP-N-acetylmuramoyl-L-alanyl-D-glutamate--2,6-diaminopimelate ligase